MSYKNSQAFHYQHPIGHITKTARNLCTTRISVLFGNNIASRTNEPVGGNIPPK